MNSREKHQLYVCTECLTIGRRIRVMQGSWIVRVILFMCGIVPGIAYSAWQESTKKYVCPSCKKDSMIPVDTPKGRQLTIDAVPFVYERSIDTVVPVIDQDVGVNIQAKTTPNSVATNNRTVGLFVICGLILSALMWWRLGSTDKERITKIDFRNHTYSSAGLFGPDSESVTLKNGKFIEQGQYGDFGTQFNSVEYADLNNDGEAEAIVSLGTNLDVPAGTFIADYFIFSFQKEQLKEIYHTIRNNPPKEIKVVNNAIIITGYHWKPDDPQSSPSEIEATTYGWKDGAINELSKHIDPVIRDEKETEAMADYPKEMPSKVRTLVEAWYELNESCRGGPGNDPSTFKSCDAREIAYAGIKKRGWCLGEDATSGVDMEWKECISRSGEPISYAQFYAKARTSMHPGKRYRFQASLNQFGCLDTIDHSGNQALCSVDMSLFDDNTEQVKWLESGVDYKGEVVAEMVYASGGGGIIAINRLPGVDTGKAKNYSLPEPVENEPEEPTIPMFSGGNTRKQLQEQPKHWEFEQNKPENTSSLDTPQIMVMRILEYALDDGGLSHESEIQQTKLQIESLHKPAIGKKKAARAINDKGLAFFKNYDFNNAVKMFEEANELDKSDVEIVNNLGFSYLKQGNLDSAQQAIILALTMSPGRATAWANLGEVFGARGYLNQAVACFSNTYRFSNDKLKTHQFMKKLNETEVMENVKQARAKAIRWAEKSYLNI